LKIIGRVLLLVALCASAHAQVLQEQHPNTARGFEPEKMYDFSAVDSVNMFNGNLTLHIPIGPKLAVNGQLPYQLTLMYNSNCWDYFYWYDQPIGGGATTTMLQAMPTRRANAGIGWMLSLGRILPPEPAEETRDGRQGTYESIDGADHPLYGSLHGEPSDNVHLYSRDGSYIRATPGTASWLIELPDGISQTVAFLDTSTTPWTTVGMQSSTTTVDKRLVQMTDRFGNSVSISYQTTSTYQEVWTITGAGTTPIKAYFKTPAQLGLTTSYDKVLLDHVDVPTTGGGTATYQLTYAAYVTPPGAGDTFTQTADHYRAPISAAFLTKVTLPTGEKYSFTYDTQWSDATHSGTITPAVPLSMTLPAGGTVTWAWDQAVFDENSWQKAKAQTPVPLPAAVQERHYGGGTWKYNQTMGGTYCSVDLNGNPCPPNTAVCFGGMRQKTVSVTSPDATTVAYFSVYKRGSRLKLGSDYCSVPEGWNSAEYGLPFTRFCPDSDSVCGARSIGGVALYPSTDIRTDFSAFPNTWNGQGRLPGQSLRSSWAAYELDPYTDSSLPLPPQNPRTIGAMTRYEDDSNCGGVCYSGSNSYGFDGYGHFRQRSSFSNFGSAFLTTFTNYDGNLDAAGDWVLGTWSEQCVAQEAVQRTAAISACSSLPGAFVTQASFDRATGAMKARRTQSGAASGSADLLAVFQRDTADRGHVSREKYYGGDVHPLTTSTDAFTPSSALEYQIDHSYTFSSNTMTATSSKYDGFTFNVDDSDFDVYTGLMAHTRDTAGVQTNFEYDSSNRLTAVKPTGRAWTEYVYTIASSGTPASVAVKQRPYNTTATATPLTDKRVVFDVWGRPLRQSQLGPNSWSASETSYDGMGRPSTVSQPESTGSGPPTGALTKAYQTSYSYDAFGRQKTITIPDGSTTTFNYLGARQKTRTAKIWTGGQADSPFDVVELYDDAGRLAQVTEKSGPTTATSVVGSNVDTVYGYDAADRLISVKMGSAQNRIFDYDGRGFLRWESQPESGMTSYSYDSRGHAVSKNQSNANSQFDVNYVYDAAERLIRVDGRNPLADGTSAQPPFRVFKEFQYGAANSGSDLRNGKLITAIRHNYGETTTDAEYDVKHEYQYKDAAGRKTDRTTTITQISRIGTFTVEQLTTSMAYNDLDLPATITYPMCIDCGAPPQDPDRSSMTRTYTAGRLTALSNFATDISYWPDGLRDVLTHANGMVDTQSVSSMPRPDSIGFAAYDRCVRPSFAAQPVGGTVPSGGGSVTLSVTMSGTAPFTYQWYEASTPATVIGTGSSIDVSPTSTGNYYVTVSNACGFEMSQTAVVTASGCVSPSTGIINAVAQPDGSWILTPNPVTRAAPTYSWKRLSDNAIVGSSRTLPVASLSATTTYQLTITDSCGSGSGTVTVNVPLPITTGLQATASQQPSGPWIVYVTWPVLTGANSYTILRRTAGGDWQTVGTSNGTSYTDASVVASQSYLYTVRADNGRTTDADIATTVAFTAAVPLQPITPAPLNSMLDAVNRVRGFLGWPAVTWSNILAASDPLPAPGALITSRQIIACRARMNEALQALGIVVRDYTNPDLIHLTIKAVYINEVEQRAQ
jgi:YD repeat-containing protein